MTSFSDQLKQGQAYLTGATQIVGYSDLEVYGVPHTQHFTQELGVVTTASAASIATLAASASSVTLSGIAVTAGVASLSGGARAISMTSTGNNSGVTFTIVGTDWYNQNQRSTMLGPNNTTVTSLTTFRRITSITPSGAVTASMTIGDTDTYGFQFKVASAGKVIAVGSDGPVTPTAGAIVATTLTATAVATATTGDVRGTIQFPTTGLANGSRYLTVTYITPNVGLTTAQDTKENSYGVAPFSG